MFTNIRLTFLLGLLPLAISCSEFIEHPLEKAHVTLLAPADNYVSTDTIVNFWWATHEDAKFYRLQLAKPSFDKINTFYLDTLVHSDQIKLDIDTGTYEWRVRPENNGSAGVYGVRRLTVQPVP